MTISFVHVVYSDGEDLYDRLVIPTQVEREDDLARRLNMPPPSQPTVSIHPQSDRRLPLAA